jgi:hypothetical protein
VQTGGGEAAVSEKRRFFLKILKIARFGRLLAVPAVLLCTYNEIGYGQSRVTVCMPPPEAAGLKAAVFCCAKNRVRQSRDFAEGKIVAAGLWAHNCLTAIMRPPELPHGNSGGWFQASPA